MAKAKNDIQLLEDQLLIQLERIEQEMNALESERKTLQGLILRVRQQNALTKDVTRRNSFSRILVENKIIETLKRKQRAVRTSELYEITKLSVYDLKETTFRSYLSRMKSKGQIKQAQRGYWLAVE